eukprot:TRINITY_DN11551_c0_g1_i1.p1 TRINITY_DN11551_c0_g1~~TRINITY_DN11551_c0_g1_i1.p1  ORF type:complete len:104 (+),score=27.85 TRINITY_DN11551_c0_g1_i1:147-458(+)
MVEEQHEQGTVALDESYADESYDYGQYEGYDDGSGMVEASGMTMGATEGSKGTNTRMFQDYIAKSDQNYWLAMHYLWQGKCTEREPRQARGECSLPRFIFLQL